MSQFNIQVRLKSHPLGKPTTDNFEIVETPLPAPHEGEVLCRTIYLSLDPYMRGRMGTGASYASGVALGDVMVGGTVSEVVESRDGGFQPGDLVLGYNGWQSYAAIRASELRKLDPAMGRISYALGVLGMPGMTAYAALLDIGKPKPGETVVVSAAAGAVGSVVGQVARIQGCRSVGLVGSDEKCRYVTGELGFDACINYRTEELAAALRASCPNGIDIYYDNVAGPILEAVLQQINLGARIPLVGLISQYNATTPPPGPNLLPLLSKRALIQGFLVSDHEHRRSDFLADMTRWVSDGRVHYREDIVDGLQNAPQAFLGLFEGRNFGKLLVRVGEEPAGKSQGSYAAADGERPYG